MRANKTKNDVWLVGAVTTLLTIGLVLVFSASAVVAQEKFGSLIYYSGRQIAWGFFCLIIIFVFSRVRYTSYQKKNFPLTGLIVTIVLLFGLFIFGDVVNGARRWYNFGIASFQPSEVAKIMLIIYFADIFSRKGDLLHDWKKGLLPHISLFALTVVPILIQPDLGTVVMITMIISVMALLSNVRAKHVLAGVALIIPALIIKIQSSGYQSSRISDWYNNFFNPLGSGHQIKQSLIGLGTGGLFGSGIGSSKQKFYFLPDSHTDFAFSILGEEGGFLMTTVVLLLFLVILWRGIRIAKRAPSTFAQYLAIGMTVNLVLYGFINVAVVTMLVPATGLPMPFLSYGGSSLIGIAFAVGILMNISRNIQNPNMDTRLEQFREDKTKFYNTLVGSR
ncbi:MAG: putative lipid II flippase FtsW [Calditrichales bacterium]|nr:MAG: putative lipid II flippase FtsW [Calditrichales bacterium]